MFERYFLADENMPSNASRLRRVKNTHRIMKNIMPIRMRLMV